MAGETALGLKALALAENPVLIPGTYLVIYDYPYHQLEGINALLTSMGTKQNTGVVHNTIYRQNTHNTVDKSNKF